MTVHSLPEIDARAPVPPVAAPRRPRPCHHQRRARRSRSPARWPPASPRARRSATATASGRRRSSTPSRRAGSGRSTCRKAYGGPELSYVTLNRVIAIISEADSSLGQIPQNHLGVVAAIRTVSDEAQKKLLFAEVLAGTRFGNAFSEFGSKRAVDFQTTFVDAGDHVIVNGRKFYSSGALLAHLVPIVALDDEGRAWYAIADRGAPGLTVIDDWSSFGQRTTLSRHGDPRQRQGAEDPPRARLQGLRGAVGRRRDLPGHPGRGRSRHRPRGHRRHHRLRAHQVARLGGQRRRPRLAGPLHHPGGRRPEAARQRRGRGARRRRPRDRPGRRRARPSRRSPRRRSPPPRPRC